MPGETVDVTIDGKAVESGVGSGQVLGPYSLSEGSHQVDFSGGDGIEQATTVEVAAGSTQDVVLHLPASVDGDALVTTYPAPVKPIGPSKARVLVAHTANVAPADIQVDGKVVFENVANGEYATADLPAGEHVVALFPTGETTDPILGPLTVDLAARSLTMVYAVGNPETDSMDLVAHTAELAADGSLVPRMIDTGSAGLAARRTGDAVRSPGPPEGGLETMGGKRVRRRPRHTSPWRSSPSSWPLPGWCGGCEPARISPPGTHGRRRPGCVEPGLDLVLADIGRPRRRGLGVPCGTGAPSRPGGGGASAGPPPERHHRPSGRGVHERPNGLLDVPGDIRTAGWWRGGARLGDPFGSTLIAAHIDSTTQGLGPYAELLRVRQGERIVVTSKHLEQRFAVASLRLVPRASLAGATDLFAPSGPRRLTMVTCAGPYDAARGGYQNLAVVTARPVTQPLSRDER